MVTMEDVAKAAGVSVSTVSRVCSGRSSISEKTKRRVQKVIEELGYVSNFSAANLATHNSRTVGIVLPPSERTAYQNTFFLEIIRGIGLVCNQNQYMNTIITAQTEEELLQAVQNSARSRRTEGYILLYSREYDPVIDYLQHEKLPYILVGKPSEQDTATFCVDTDNVRAGRDVTQHLLALGHRNIAFVFETLAYNYSIDRKSGYLLALTEQGIPIRQSYIVEVEKIPEPDNPKLRALFASPERPSAIIANDDILAVSLIRMAQTLQLRVPQDLSILSFNDSLLARFYTPPLTSVNLNAPQLGTEAAARMIQRIEQPDTSPSKAIIPHKLIQRESCIPYNPIKSPRTN